MENKSEFRDNIALRLKELEREIQELEAMADKAVAEVKTAYQEQINDLFLKKEELKEKITKIQKSTGNAWEDMKAGTELSWEAFDESVKGTFKKTE